MKKENTTKVFDIEDVGYMDLEGKKIKVNFDKRDFANALFNNAKSVDMDTFARAIHKSGKAELTDQVEAELLELAPTLWIYRASSAIKETIENLKSK